MRRNPLCVVTLLYLIIETMGASAHTADHDSVSFTQNLQDVEIVASVAGDRMRVPIALTTLTTQKYKLKAPNREFPELMGEVPSVYTSRQGGGYGDSRLTLRGFGSDNVALLINGIPVNGEENGSVYWSNWAGLSDIASKIQVQRGIGFSALGLYSVGGTINLITEETREQPAAAAYLGIGNDGFFKGTFSVGSAESAKGWSFSLLGGYSRSDGYVQATDFEAWNYYLSIAKHFNDHHRLSLTIFGSPQWHNRRSNKQAIEDYENNPNGIRMNTSYGYRDGHLTPTYSGYNEYHKPMIILTHYWNMNGNSVLTTSAYASWGIGGGRKVLGKDANLLQYNYKTGKPNAGMYLNEDGTIDFDQAVVKNQQSATGSTAILAMGTNAHSTYGALTTWMLDLPHQLKFRAGVDLRYYIGYHYDKISDLLGGAYYLDNNLAWRQADTPLKVGDKVTQDYTSTLGHVGAFSQLQYDAGAINGFLSLALSDKMYRRQDPGKYGAYGNTDLYPVEDKTTNWRNFIPFDLKAGANYRFAGYHRFFVNGGYVTRAPKFENIYNSNQPISNPIYEKIISAEAGYGFSSRQVDIQLNGYLTWWNDKSTTKAIGSWNGPKACIPNLDAYHKGIEVEVAYRPIQQLSLAGSFALGEWRWSNDVAFSYYDEQGKLVGQYQAYTKNLHVGNAPQTTLALSAEYVPIKDFRVAVGWNYYARMYADFSPDARTNEADRVDAWKMPSFNIFDLRMDYRFSYRCLPFDLRIFMNVDNLLDTHYICDATDVIDHKAASAVVWYGVGRTGAIGLQLQF